MPLYEYRCTACGHRFEKIQSFSAPDEKECPKCGSPVERLISAPAIQFKGSGFYLTDYARSGGSGKGSASAEGSKAESSAPAKSSDSSSASGSSAPAAAPSSSSGSSNSGSSSSGSSSSGSSSS